MIIARAFVLHPVGMKPTLQLFQLDIVLCRNEFDARSRIERITDCISNRLIKTQKNAQPDLYEDPKGGAQDVRRFSTRQDASSKNPDHISVRSFELDMSVFLTRACGTRPSGRLRRSRR